MAANDANNIKDDMCCAQIWGEWIVEWYMLHIKSESKSIDDAQFSGYYFLGKIRNPKIAQLILGRRSGVDSCFIS